MRVRYEDKRLVNADTGVPIQSPYEFNMERPVTKNEDGSPSIGKYTAWLITPEGRFDDVELVG
jgi:hypothetical protein